MPDNEEIEELTQEEMEKKVLPALFKRSQTDPEFRALCVEKPEEAVFEISGKKPPAGKKIQFVEPEDQTE